VALSKRWEQWSGTLSYRRQQSDSSGVGTTTVADVVSGALEWRPSPKWTGGLRLAWTRQSSATEAVQTLVAVTPVTLPLESTGRTFQDVAQATGLKTVTVDQDLHIDTWWVGLDARYRSPAGLSLRCVTYWDQKGSVGDSMITLAFSQPRRQLQFRPDSLLSAPLAGRSRPRMNPEQGFQIEDFGGVMRRRRGVGAVLAGSAFLASLVVAAVLPNVYEAWTTLLVEPQSISTRLVEADVEEAQLENRLHLMTMEILSRGRLSRIITDLGLYPEESKELTREEVISLMRDDIRVEPVVPELGVVERRQRDFQINTFRIIYRSHSAEIAASVANRLANDFIEEHIRERVQVSSGTSEFIEAELDGLSARIAEVEAGIAKVKDENPGRLPEDLDPNQRLLERAIQGLRDAQGELALARSDEAFYNQQALAGGILEGQQVLTPERRLEALELLLAEHRGRGFTEKHPDVVSTLQEIDAVHL
jgi:hypothetical protein